MNKRMAILVSALAAVGLVVGLGSWSTAGSSQNAPLLFAEDDSAAGGRSILDRNAEQGTVSARINATHLEPGGAYTYWWVVFNDPSQCLEPFACSEADIFVDPEDHSAGFEVDQINAVGISVLGGKGEIVNNGGSATFTGTLFAESALGHELLIGPGGLMESIGALPADTGSLLEESNVMTAEIHIVIRSHGPARSGAALAEQLHTFAGNCVNVPPPLQGDDPQAECVDPQFAVHR